MLDLQAAQPGQFEVFLVKLEFIDDPQIFLPVAKYLQLDHHRLDQAIQTMVLRLQASHLVIQLSQPAHMISLLSEHLCQLIRTLRLKALVSLDLYLKFLGTRLSVRFRVF